MYRRYVLRDLNFKMKASGLEAAFKSFLHYFRNVEEINIKGMENIEDAFATFDFGIIKDDTGDIVALEAIDFEMPDWFYLFLKSIEEYVEEGSIIKLYYEDDGIMREFVFYDKCFEHFRKDESIILNEYIPSEEEEKHKPNYMLLSRCKSDCEYYLGHGNKNKESLWGGNEKNHIVEMKKLYRILPVKPNWITMRRIKEYEILLGEC